MGGNRNHPSTWRKKVLFTLVVFGIALSPLSLFVPVIPGQSLFHGVGPAKDEEIVLPMSSQQFVIQDGKVYLVHQRTRYALVLVTGVEFTVWTPEKIHELRQKHRELDHDELWNEN